MISSIVAGWNRFSRRAAADISPIDAGFACDQQDGEEE